MMEWIGWFLGVRWHVVIWHLAQMAVCSVMIMWVKLKMRCIEAWMKFAEAHMSDEERAEWKSMLRAMKEEGKGAAEIRGAGFPD